MAELLAGQGHEVIFIDNASTYPPLLDYYDKCGFQVIRLPQNFGGVAAWTQDIVTGLNEYYVVSDPDYDISMVPSDWPEVLMEGFSRFPGQSKFGLTWDESTVPPENPAYHHDEMHMYQQSRGAPLPNNWYAQAMDTSFAISRPGSRHIIDGFRKGSPYKGIHLPWHIVLKPSADPTKRSVLMNDEIVYYFEHCETSSFTWPRIMPMVFEYVTGQPWPYGPLDHKHALEYPKLVTEIRGYYPVRYEG